MDGWMDSWWVASASSCECEPVWVTNWCIRSVLECLVGKFCGPTVIALRLLRVGVRVLCASVAMAACIDHVDRMCSDRDSGSWIDGGCGLDAEGWAGLREGYVYACALQGSLPVLLNWQCESACQHKLTLELTAGAVARISTTWVEVSLTLGAVLLKVTPDWDIARVPSKG